MSGFEWVVRFFGLAFLFAVLAVFFTWLQAVDLASWLAMESYDTVRDWMRELGVIIASMLAFAFMINFSIDVAVFKEKSKGDRE